MSLLIKKTAMTTTADSDPACDKVRVTEFQTLCHENASNTVSHISIIRFNFFNLFIYNQYFKSSSCDSYVLLLSRSLHGSGSSIATAAHMARHLASTL